MYTISDLAKKCVEYRFVIAYGLLGLGLSSFLAAIWLFDIRYTLTAILLTGVGVVVLILAFDYSETR